MVGKLK